jgi:phosphoglycerate dehydrogenase-like enzyme
MGVPERVEAVYAEHLETLKMQTRLYSTVVSGKTLEEHLPQLREVEVIFSTWGMPRLAIYQLDAMPRLRAVFYAAGSVQSFATPLLERGITLTSSWAANAVPVAEFSLAQILLANKNYFENSRVFTSPQKRHAVASARGNFGASVALLGAGQIGRKLIELMKPFRLRVLVFDPFLSDEDARAFGVEKVSLEEAFSRGDVVSNHLANLPATVRMLKGEYFARMKPNATFINTGRGQTVAEDELCAVMGSRPDIIALLDVTHPEPPVPGSPLYALPNVFLSSHIAGSVGDEVRRMADYAVDEFVRWQSGEPLRFQVTPELLETMA